ncbi:energy-coupling factor transporter transmembrane component T family protein [Herbinix luporum]|jgi:energy-coupling factor transport system permease protein|uniref:Energy-coupling factor transporter transmembrane protein EcfT n=1 Tax=Herbinix luporum TaxID=1679721 RepID=A0A0K8J310_9FIRM|nr:energy-coupling factor transporter transmembrane component T [Herbinix luporum]MDI9489507.1 energy-coupling factor transporter transmembrane component T [Bacillota bacterium]CUH91902.1 Energy-coupling factor transporter transmembrane protein EcfT [Herbinix luporum]HHT57152.1 energy-coupling factor transporter transmembrane protein EcfT [Herbinix luporum]
MIRDITIGQYYPADSILHRLDPRLKLSGTMLYIISIFLFDTFYGYIAVIIFLASIIKLSKVPLKFIIRGLKSIMFILLFTMAFNMFLTKGDIIFRLGFLKVTKQGLYSSIFMGSRLTLLLVGSSMMTYTTTPNQLTDGLERLLSPLTVFKVQVHEIAMMMSIALRFIPILVDETDKIMKAQMARGADFESGGLIKRAKSLIPLLVPLFVSAFRRALDLAMAMEARCYRGGQGRTKMKPLQYESKDYFAYGILALYLACVITISIIENRLPGLL